MRLRALMAVIGRLRVGGIDGAGRKVYMGRAASRSRERLAACAGRGSSLTPTLPARERGKQKTRYANIAGCMNHGAVAYAVAVAGWGLAALATGGASRFHTTRPGSNGVAISGLPGIRRIAKP
jgi:hypothetical protein